MTRVTALAALLALLLAACGGAAATEQSSPDPQEAMLDFARCMREHGIDMPDPGADGDFTVGGEVVDPRSPEFTAAQEACADLLEEAIGDLERPDPQQRAEIEADMLAFARCMREHGIDFPDPQFDGGMAIIGPSEGSEFDPEDPEVVAATEACRDLLPEDAEEAP
jgi:hypothetical protein